MSKSMDNPLPAWQLFDRNDYSYRYEHRISDSDKTIIQVRPERAQDGQPSLWGIYMQCTSVEDARRVFALLNNPITEVLP